MCKLFIIVSVLYFVSCTNEFSEFKKYSKFDEYTMTPSGVINDLDKKPENYIQFNSKGNEIKVILMPGKTSVQYQKVCDFWYSNMENFDKGTGLSTNREVFIMNDTVYKLETSLSESSKIEMQLLTIKTKGKDFYITDSILILDLDLCRRFKKVRSILDDKQAQIVVKEWSNDTLFSYDTNNDRLNTKKKCVFGVVKFDNLGEFGSNFYTGESLTAWFIKIHPELGICK